MKAKAVGGLRTPLASGIVGQLVCFPPPPPTLFFVVVGFPFPPSFVTVALYVSQPKLKLMILLPQPFQQGVQVFTLSWRPLLH